MGINLDAIRSFVRNAHDGQERKFSGKPYAVHPIRVGKMIDQEQENRILAAAGFLHDVLEDTDESEEQVRSISNEEVLEIVKRLSHDPDYDHKVQAIAHSLEDHEDARLVKLYDRLDNVCHLDQATDEFVVRYTQETRELLNWFQNSGTNPREDNLIDRIKTILSTNCETIQ
jgi:(p)ppGpp synthase/HD superfamily hydrolase